MPQDVAFDLLDQLLTRHQEEVSETKSVLNEKIENQIVLRQKDLQILLGLIEDWESDNPDELIYRMRNLQRFLSQAARTQ